MKDATAFRDLRRRYGHDIVVRFELARANLNLDIGDAQHADIPFDTVQLFDEFKYGAEVRLAFPLELVFTDGVDRKKGTRMIAVNARDGATFRAPRALQPLCRFVYALRAAPIYCRLEKLTPIAEVKTLICGAVSDALGGNIHTSSST
jgi:hypothetical protein